MDTFAKLFAGFAAGCLFSAIAYLSYPSPDDIPEVESWNTFEWDNCPTVIFSFDTHTLQCGGKYPSEREAKDLAKNNPGSTVYIARTVNSFTTEPVHKEDY